MKPLEDCKINKYRSKKALKKMEVHIKMGYEKYMWKDGNMNSRWMHQQEQKVSKHGFYP